MKFVDKLFNFYLYHFMSKGARSRYLHYTYNTNPKHYPQIGEHVHLMPPLYLNPRCVELESYTRLQGGVRIVAVPGKQKVIVKKYTAISAECLLIPGAHVPTVGLPQYLSYTHINDVHGTIVIPEDVWVATRCTILKNAQIGRGCVIASNSLVNKSYPPYSVIAGSPAKVIAVRFSLEQILEHEAQLYPEEERIPKETLRKLFDNEYKGLRVIGTDKISHDDAALLEETKRGLNIDIYS